MSSSLYNKPCSLDVLIYSINPIHSVFCCKTNVSTAKFIMWHIQIFITKKKPLIIPQIMWYWTKQNSQAKIIKDKLGYFQILSSCYFGLGRPFEKMFVKCFTKSLIWCATQPMLTFNFPSNPSRPPHCVEFHCRIHKMIVPNNQILNNSILLCFFHSRVI